MENKTNQKDTIILHDHFLYYWWGERLVSLLAKWLDADLATWFFNPNSMPPENVWFKNQFIKLSKPTFSQWWRHFKMMWVFKTKTKFLKNYKTVIFSWNCFDAIDNAWNAQKIYYCHTPPRYLYDLYKHHLNQKKWIKKFLFKLLVPILRKNYENKLKKFDKIVTNSKNIQKRLKNFCGYNSTVVYPPIDTKSFVPGESEDFYLSFARLTDIKRVHLVVEAFSKMPDKKLVLTYNPSDPYYEYVKKIADKCENITMLKNVPVLEDLVKRCIATIYIPKDEDFWMSPVESMAAWKPCIWVNDWWIKETIIDWKTWVLLPKEVTVEDIIWAVNEMTLEKAKSMEKDCIERAKDFDLEKFLDGIRDVLEK